VNQTEQVGVIQEEQLEENPKISEPKFDPKKVNLFQQAVIFKKLKNVGFFFFDRHFLGRSSKRT